jgi:hypothetical protein
MGPSGKVTLTVHNAIALQTVQIPPKYNSIDVVVLKIETHQSKKRYEFGYQKLQIGQTMQ